MKRVLVVLTIVLALAAVGGAGYLGARSVQGEVEPAGQAPATTEVTRGDVQQTVTAPGRLVNTRQATLALEVSGKLAGVGVQPGQSVQAGDVLAQLDAAPLAANVETAQTELELARLRLDRLQAGPSAAELIGAQVALADAEARLRQLQAPPPAADLAAAQAAVTTARAELEQLEALPGPQAVAQAQALFDKATVALQQAQAAYDRVKGQPDVGMTPQALGLQQATIDYEAARAALERAGQKATAAQLQAARARLASAQAARDQLDAGPSADELAAAEMQLEQAQVALDRLEAGPDAVELKLAEMAVQAAESTLAQARSDLARATLAAPFAGTVLEVRTQPGEMVTAGAGLIVLADPTAIEVETTVIEEDLPLIEAGQPVELFFDARPDAEVWGQVARIVPERVPGDRPLYPVYITLSSLPPELVAGMTADASIVVASRSDVLRLPRAIVRARQDGTATLQVWTGSQIEARPVRTGLRGDVHIEILDGLRQGEQVVAQ
ncbi:MAG: efflux RND transporter periplasmic adaptor subunit [Anaerolineae bacterium]|jgi:HlyD family secretion protein